MIAFRVQRRQRPQVQVVMEYLRLPSVSCDDQNVQVVRRPEPPGRGHRGGREGGSLAVPRAEERGHYLPPKSGRRGRVLNGFRREQGANPLRSRPAYFLGVSDMRITPCLQPLVAAVPPLLENNAANHLRLV